MKISVKLSDTDVLMMFECETPMQARELAESIVEQLKKGTLDLQLVDPVHIKRDTKEVN